MYKEDLALNNLQWLICHKTKPKLRDKFLSQIDIYIKNDFSSHGKP